MLVLEYIFYTHSSMTAFRLALRHSAQALFDLHLNLGTSLGFELIIVDTKMKERITQGRSRRTFVNSLSFSFLLFSHDLRLRRLDL